MRAQPHRLAPRCRSKSSQAELAEVDADLLVVGLYEGEELPGRPRRRRGRRRRQGRLPEADDAPSREAARGRWSSASASARRWTPSGPGSRRRSPPRRRPGSRRRPLAWLLPGSGDDAAIAEGVVTGTILGSYRFDRFRSPGPRRPGAAADRVADPARVRPTSAAAAEAARVCAEAQNRARDLQSLPSNVATPSYLGRRAREIASAHDSVSTEVLGRDEMAAKEMGGLVAVSQGSAEEPQLIVLRYEGGGSGPTLGLVGKGVTFDTGGISIKPSAGMQEMKMDMSGAAAVLEAVAAIAELELPVEPDRRHPLDREHALGHRDQARRHHHPVQRQDGRGQQHRRRGPPDPRRRPRLRGRARRRADRRPRDPDRRRADRARLDLRGADLQRRRPRLRGRRRRRARPASWSGGCPCTPSTRSSRPGTVADLTNASDKRKAGTIYAGSFLEEFVDGTPWAHIDIAGTAWDVGRAYTGDGASGFGVRLLVELARRLSS